MTRSLRFFALPAAVAAAVAVCTVNPTARAESELLNEHELFAAADDPQLASAKQALDQRLQAVAARTAYKEDLIDQLLAGRVGLMAVTDGFLEANASAPECVSVMRLYHPGCDDREAAARGVLEYARQRVEPAAWPAVRRRLTGEYQAAFHHLPQ